MATGIFMPTSRLIIAGMIAQAPILGHLLELAQSCTTVAAQRCERIVADLIELLPLFPKGPSNDCSTMELLSASKRRGNDGFLAQCNGFLADVLRGAQSDAERGFIGDCIALMAELFRRSRLVSL